MGDDTLTKSDASKIRRSLPACTLILLAPLLMSACAGPLSQQAALATPVTTAAPTVERATRGQGGVLRLIYYDAPTLLNPHLAGGIKDLEASRIVYEPLASFDREDRLIPFLAAAIPSRQNGGLPGDGLSVTWKLKQGVRWSDGQPFTAEDVKFTYEYIVNPDVQATFVGNYEAVRSVDVIDPYTVRVNFKAPTPAWAVPFVGKPGMILPRHIFAPYNGPNARSAKANLQAVGTGPYQVVVDDETVGPIKPQEMLFLGNQLVRTSKIVFEPNPLFREPDRPFFSRVELRGGGTIEQAFNTVLEDGTADYAWNIQLLNQPEPQADKYGQVLVNFGANIHFMPLNRSDPNQGSDPSFSNPFFQDKRVRQAFAYAIDRDRIIREVYTTAGVSESNFVTLPQQFRSPNTFYSYDPQKAAALLDQAGWVVRNGNKVREKDGKQLQVIYQLPVSPIAQRVQQIIKQNLEAIGVAVVTDLKDINVFYGTDTTNPDSYVRFLADVASWDWINDSPDPAPNLSYWTCAGIPTAQNKWSGFNISRWCNPEFDQLLQQARAELDPQKRRELFIKMNDLLVEDVAFIVIARVAQLSAVSKTIHGVDLTPWDTDTWNIKDWKRVTTP